MGPRAASPMNHSVPMNSMGSVPGVSACPPLSCAETALLQQDSSPHGSLEVGNPVALVHVDCVVLWNSISLSGPYYYKDYLTFTYFY